MSYVKRCKKIVCERVVREKWFVKHDKIVCGTGVGQVACERHPHPSPTMGKPGCGSKRALNPRAYQPSPHATVWVGDPTLPTDQQSLKGFRQPTVPFSRRCQPFLSPNGLLPLYCANPPGQLCFAELTQTLAHDQNR